jgi:hypothetical protein
MTFPQHINFTGGNILNSILGQYLRQSTQCTKSSDKEHVRPDWFLQYPILLSLLSILGCQYPKSQVVSTDLDSKGG